MEQYNEYDFRGPELVSWQHRQASLCNVFLTMHAIFLTAWIPAKKVKVIERDAVVPLPRFSQPASNGKD